MSFLSVRMRASLKGKHVSGAERIVKDKELEETLSQLVKRPSDYDQMVITIEKVRKLRRVEESLKLSSFNFNSVSEARQFALRKLKESGVPESVALKGLNLISRGANPRGGIMRGAVLMDIETGNRLEKDSERGVRTVRIDWENRREILEILRKRGLTERTADALALATKNIICGVVAELCWSDDPQYLTGYVASRTLGYVRITPLKEKGDPLGGRIYFVRREKLLEIVKCLEEEAILLKRLQD